MPPRKDPPSEKSDDPPHYHGHRERLRERFHSAGPDALSDYELLEMALFAAVPRRDTKPLAKAMLKKFGSFAEVVHAPENLLREVDGVGDASITQLKLLAAAARPHRQGRDQAKCCVVVVGRCDRNTAAAAWRLPTRSSFGIFFLDKRNQLIADDI